MIKLENVGLASPEQMEFIIEGMRNPMSPKEFHMDAHIRLYSMMQRKGFTYDDLSEETGISPGTISNYVNGVTSPTLDRLFLIAKALGCRIEDLIYIEHMYR